MTIEWEEITDHQHNYIDEVFQLYDQAFPIEVREPHQIFLNSLQYAKHNKPNNYRILLGLQDLKLVSFAAGHYLAASNSGFLVYLATKDLQRSKGLGTQTLLKFENLLNDDARLAGEDAIKAIVLETEKPEFVHSHSEREGCAKRERFYKKNGFQLYNEITYVQPPLNGGDEYVPLNLFIKQESLTKQEIEEIIYDMYKEKYGASNKINPRILDGGLSKMDLPSIRKH